MGVLPRFEFRYCRKPGESGIVTPRIKVGETRVTGLKAELITPFVTGTKEVFETMAGLKIRRKAIYLKSNCLMYGDISGIIGLSGPTTGTCAISLPEGLAVRIIESLLGEPLGDNSARAEVNDGVGELINMIAGRAKTLLSSTTYHFDITLPTIISGKNHEFFQRKGTHCVVVVFETEHNESFTLDVAIAPR